jgi:hypothetical protein
VRRLTNTLAESDPEKERAFLESEEKRDLKVTRMLRALRARQKATGEARPLFAILPGVGIGPFQLA